MPLTTVVKKRVKMNIWAGDVWNVPNLLSRARNVPKSAKNSHFSTKNLWQLIGLSVNVGSGCRLAESMSIFWTTFNTKDIIVSLTLNEWQGLKVELCKNHKNVNNSAILCSILKSFEIQVGTYKVHLQWKFHLDYSKVARVMLLLVFFWPNFKGE